MRQLISIKNKNGQELFTILISIQQLAHFSSIYYDCNTTVGFYRLIFQNTHCTMNTCFMKFNFSRFTMDNVGNQLVIQINFHIPVKVMLKQGI